jgi:hypothetical protein
MDDEQDPNYVVLNDTLKLLIDTAFDSILEDKDDNEHPNKRRRVDSPALIDRSHTHIPLSLIPAALAQLNLPPDDPDVLDVFRNAASGWSLSHPNHSETQTVSRKDFRAVCAVLLDSDQSDFSPPSPAPLPPPSHTYTSTPATPINEPGGFLIEDDTAAPGGFIPPTLDDDDSGEDSDGYQDPDSSLSSDSADEYTEHPSSTHRPTKSKFTSKKSRSSDNETETTPAKSKPLSTHQKHSARSAFALFFPDIADPNLDAQRITIRDISRVAGLLKEKITAEEVCIPFIHSLISSVT